MTLGCCGVSDVFDDAKARDDLDEFRRRGPSASTARLIAAVRDAGDSFDSLLDVGGGVGAIAHELLAEGVARATLVDGSLSYLDAARIESARRMTTSRLDVRAGDLVEIAHDVDAADVVTLDKVVCCYEDMDGLLAASAERARQLFGIVYPLDAWWVRLWIAVENRMLKWKGSSFRGFVHGNAAIDRALQGAGLAPKFRRRGIWWVVALYERS